MANIAHVKLPNNLVYDIKDPIARANATTALEGVPQVITLTLTAAWTGTNPYTQQVSIANATANSKIDLQPDATILAKLMTAGVTALYIENNNGTFTAYALGGKPTSTIHIQACMTKVINEVTSS